MAEKLPVIIDNRGDNTVVHALRRLLPNLQKMDAVTSMSLRSTHFCVPKGREPLLESVL
jgi:hypothetical protein